MSKKIRVYELARELELDSKVLLKMLPDMGINVKTVSSGLDSSQAKKVRTQVAPLVEKAKSSKAEESETVEKPKPKVRAVKVRIAQKGDSANTFRAGSKTSDSAPPAVKVVKKIEEEPENTPEQENEKPKEEVKKTIAKSSDLSPEELALIEVTKESEVKKSEAKKEEKPSEAEEFDIKKSLEELKNKVSTTPVAAKSSNDDSSGRGRKRGGRSREFHHKEKKKPASSSTYFAHNRGFKKKKKKNDSERKVIEELIVEIPEIISLSDLAGRMQVSASDVIKYLMKQGHMVTINHPLEYEQAKDIVEAYGIQYKEAGMDDIDLDLLEDKVEGEQVPRPPVVTVLGHVDHGKTSLLDYIRSANVTEGEAGGITQRIGAYSVIKNDKPITFIDTPGHAAFTQMRARGAKVTDIVVLVVAADDGVMPQTVEAISHAKAADVPIIVALNKIDKPDANPEKIMQQLAEHEIIVEDWGGDIPCVRVSAMTGEGIDDLLDMITLITDLQELTAVEDCPAQGTIIEARLDKGFGSIATVLVQQGILHVGDIAVVGGASGKIRALLDQNGKRVKQAKPSYAVEIIGLSDVPEAGDSLVVVDDEKSARTVAEARAQKQRLAGSRSGKTSLEDLFSGMAEGEKAELKVLIKADGHGSVEALQQSLEKLSNDEVTLNTIHGAVGAITESDVMLASASDAIIIGFNVRPGPAVKKVAEQENVEIRLYKVIYHVIEDIEQAMAGLLEPELQEEELGRVEIREVMKVSKIGKIAGCYVLEGKITRDSQIRLVRDGILIWEGKLDSLKRFKDDVKEVTEGFECGLTLANYSDFQEGDILEAYKVNEIARESLN